MTRVATLSIYGLITAILILSGLSVPVSAQTGSIRLEGSVWDPSGNSLAGAVLTAVEESTNRQSNAVSDEEGRYVFPGLQPGTYTVTVKAKGFKDVIHRNMHIYQPGSISEDFSFEVSAIDKEVAVAEITRINDSERSGSFSRKEIKALPNPDVDPLSLLIYQPGVSIDPRDPGASTVNGTRPAMSGIGMDGLSTTDQVQPRMDASMIELNPDRISEIQIVTSGAKAEYGRSGGAQFTVVSRPGDKSWSGEIYDYLRNKNLDANDFFNNSSGVSKPTFTRNIFGGSVSGPAFGKNTLVFGNFEGTRIDQQVTRTRQVLTDEAKSGLFRWYTPGTSTLSTFNIPTNDPRHLGIDPSIVPILAKLPSPNTFTIGDGLNIAGYKFNNPAYLDRQTVSARLDHRLGSNQQLFFRVNWARLDTTDLSSGADAVLPGEKNGTQFSKNIGVMAGYDWVVSPNLLNQLRVGYVRPETELKRPARLTTPMYLANTWANPLDPSFPRSYRSQVFEASDYLAHSVTAHNLKYGASFRQTVQNNVDYSGVYPNVTFGLAMGNNPSSSIGPSGVSVISNSDRKTFEYLYNDLLGRIESVAQTYNSSLNSVLPAGSPKTRNFRFMEFSGFIQDDWRILPNLTLNLGVRYELSSVPKEKDGFQGVLDQASQMGYSANISNFKVLQGSGWYSRNVSDFAPRAGFAWDPFNSGTLVLRGGYGIYSDRLIGAVTNFIDQNSYGFAQNLSLYPNSAGGDLRLSDGVATPGQPSVPVAQLPATRSQSIAVLDSKLGTPRVHQFNLTLEKRLWGSVLEAAYVGTRGKGLFQYVNLNQTNTAGDFLQSFKELQAYRRFGTPVPISNTLVRIFGSPLAAMNALGNYVLDSGQVGAAADTVDRNYYSKYAAAGVSDFYLRNFPQFNNVLFGTNAGESWYNALQLGLRKSTRYSNLRVNYTWSKSIDNLSTDGNIYVSPSNSRNPWADKAYSDFDRTHVFTAAFNWALPYGRTHSPDAEYSKWMDRLFGGWNLGLLYVRESGSHFSVNSGMENRFAGVKSLANYSGSGDPGLLYKNNNIVYWFAPEDAALFTNPAAGEAPSSGRNAFVGPNYINLDFLMQKRFMLGESKNLQFRIEAFNLFNSVHFGNPVTNMYDSSFGTITSTQGNPRRMQVALRFAF